MNSFRIIDANINRACEGLRVLEDTARFVLNNNTLTEKLKTARHNIRKLISDNEKLIFSRDSLNDVGYEVSKKTELDIKKNTEEIIYANFKRVQEALRVIEENIKVENKEISKKYEELRFRIYSLEKEYIGEYKKVSILKNIVQGIYCITAEEHSRGRSNVEVVKEMIESGIKIIQYREKENKSILEKYMECLEIRKLTKEKDVIFIVNDNIDIAILVGADGVHVGQDDLPVEQVRELIGENMIIGLSTHSPEQAQAAVKSGADYIGVGPIFATKTKKNVCEPVGLEYLEYVVRNIDIPFVAIGGIKEHNILEVIKKGTECIAVVTEIVGADKIGEKIKILQEKINNKNI